MQGLVDDGSSRRPPPRRSKIGSILLEIISWPSKIVVRENTSRAMEILHELLATTKATPAESFGQPEQHDKRR